MSATENIDTPKFPLRGTGGSGVHVLGIRHHGPGSARNVRDFLEALRPDIVLVEGPPEADSILQWAVHKEIKPPVAILCYQPDEPQRSVFYPFAEFSPEWQAIQYARTHNIPVRFFDLPISHQLAIQKQQREEEDKEEVPTSEPLQQVSVSEGEVYDLKSDPIAYLAEAAGYEEGEKWWEQMFEYRHNSEQVFEAVTEAMQTLRSNLRLKPDRMEQLREAHMRKMIRQAERELYTTIAVICGAWHAPALVSMPKQKEDNELLKGLPKVKVECTWIPWTYNRLSYHSGYGAGIHSPGWYEHIWQYPTDDGTRWMSKVAQVFRKKGMDTSVAHVIEAVRLAESLASLRGFSKSGLEELNEATLSVLCNGESLLLQLVHDELIVSDTIGEVPTDIPKPPLQVDIEKQQKSLRLPPTADFKDYTLDLRKDTDLARSILLHRLRLLGVKWGTPSQASGKGTFKEQWRLQWDPAFSIDIIEKGSWGNTVEEAATQYVIHQVQDTKSLLAVSELLEEALPAELHRAVDALMQQINNLAAASGDAVLLMQAIPPLVNVSRYGNVRGTDATLVLQIVSSMIARVCIGFPNAVSGIDEEAALEVADHMNKLQDSVNLLQQEDITVQWQGMLQTIAYSTNAAPHISGYATRLLSDFKLLENEALIKLFHIRMSKANKPNDSAAWLGGFLKGCGSILLIDEALWTLVNQWVAQLDASVFNEVLPLLRRTFANFTPPERKKLGEKSKSGQSGSTFKVLQETQIHTERARKGLPIVLHLLGIKQPS
jgi:Family of unknown function (DUF5682)